MTRSPPAKTTPLTRAAFLAAVAASGVGPTVRELSQQLDDLAPNTPVASVAHRLVVRGVLTKYQADQLLTNWSAKLTVGPYLLLEPLGDEDGGRLFRARQRVMDRLVCLWVSPANNPRAAARLSAARRAARLTHPHILTVIDVLPTADRPHVVTEYVDGAGLDAVLRLAGRLPVGRSCDLLRQVASALAHAHDRGVSHGKLTAEAVRVGRPGGGGPEGQMTVKLTGFAGDPGNAETVCADLLSLGRMATHMLAGNPDAPLPAGTPPELAILIAELRDANPYRRPGAVMVVERLAPFADAEFEPTPTEPPVVACPFAELSAEMPAVTPPTGERHGWAVAGVAVAVGLLTAGLVAVML